MRPEQIRQRLATGEMGHEDAAKAFIKFHKDSTSSEVPREQGEGSYSQEDPPRQSDEVLVPRNREDSSRFSSGREGSQLNQRRERQIASEVPTIGDRRRGTKSSKAVRVWSGVKPIGSFVKDGFVAMSEFGAEHPKKFIFTFTGIATATAVPISILAGNGFWPIVGNAATTFGVSGTSSLLIIQPVLAKFHNWREGRKRRQISNPRLRTFGFETRLGQPFTT